MKTKPNKPETKTELGELLKTEDPAMQIQRTRELLAAASSPVLQLMITFDPRAGKIVVYAMTTNGAQMDYTSAHQLLDGARAELVKAETEHRAAVASGTDKGE